MPVTTHQPGRPGVRFRADAAGARGPDGHVFRDVSLAVPAGSLTVLTGPGGSGRTSLLLALGGRFRVDSGRVLVDDRPLPGAAAYARRRVSIARAGADIGVEPRLRVRELIAERRAVGGPGVTGDSLARAFTLAGLAGLGDVVAARLTTAGRLLLAVALAAAEDTGAVLVDDVDAGLGGDDLDGAWRVLRDLAARGTTVVATATGPAPGYADHVVEIPEPGVAPAAPAARRDRGGA